MKAILLLVFSLFLSSCGQPPPSLARLPENAMILAFGDSLTYGTGAAPPQSYPSVLSQLTGFQVINAGVPGEISEHGLNRLPELLDDQQPDLLILIHGGNDILRKIPPDRTEHNIRQMIAAARTRGIEVVMLGVPNPALFLMSSAGLYQQIAADQAVASDLEILPRILGDRDLKSDMVHPNARGYRMLAENIRQLLQERGAL